MNFHFPFIICLLFSLLIFSWWKFSSWAAWAKILSYLFLFCFIIISLRYNCHTVNCTYLKCTTWYVLIYKYNHEAITSIKIMNTCTKPKDFLWLLYNPLYLILLLPLAIINLLSITVDLFKCATVVLKYNHAFFLRGD